MATCYSPEADQPLTTAHVAEMNGVARRSVIVPTAIENDANVHARAPPKRLQLSADCSSSTDEQDFLSVIALSEFVIGLVCIGFERKSLYPDKLEQLNTSLTGISSCIKKMPQKASQTASLEDLLTRCL